MQVQHIYQNINLDFTDFSNKCLVGIKFVKCNIRNCKFVNSDLSYVIFESCDLYRSDFSGAILYFTRLNDCDATKASFVNAFLNGIRFKDTVITYAVFGEDFNTGIERKSIESNLVNENFLQLNIGDNILDIKVLENKYDGLFIKDNNIAIEFIKNNNENQWRVLRRKSEIAISIKNIFEENGYKDKSLHYYFLHRQFLRKSNKNFVLRFVDYVGNELFWGYGVKPLNPIVFFFVNCFIFSIIYSFLPLINDRSGIKYYGKIIKIFDDSYHLNLLSYLKVAYTTFLFSTLSVFGDVDIVGYGRIFVVIQVSVSVLLIGLGVTSLSKKLANS